VKTSEAVIPTRFVEGYERRPDEIKRKSELENKMHTREDYIRTGEELVSSKEIS
jgi:hypothetical protein